MNIFDIAIILLIILSAIIGFKQGALKTSVNFIGTIIVYIIAFCLKDKLGILLCRICPFFNFNGYVTINILLYQLIAFVLIAAILFTIFNLVMKLTGVVQKLIDMTVILTIPSKILGFIFGLIEGYIVMFLIIAVLSIPFRNFDQYTNSKVVDNMLNNTPILSKSLSGVVDSLTSIFTITSNIDNNTTNQTDQVNLDIMKTYLDNHIISKDDALELVSMDKFTTVPGIKNFISSYNID